MLNKVVAYQLIQRDSDTALTEAVNQAIQDGWVPSGSPVASGNALHQAMVKFASD